jgi:hypothetical protein
MPRTTNAIPLRHEEAAKYKDLAPRPNPKRYAIGFMPALGALLLSAESTKGSALTQSEVQRLLQEAPAIALTAAQVRKLGASRGYKDVDPTHLYES